MNKSKVLSLYNTLVDFANQKLVGTKWNYGLLKNINLLGVEVKAISEAQKKNEKFVEYENQRMELVKKYADKNEAGNPKIENGGYVFSPESLESINKEGEELASKYQEPIKEINEFLQQECDMTLYKISIDDLPTELGSDKINKLMDIIL